MRRLITCILSIILTFPVICQVSTDKKINLDSLVTARTNLKSKMDPQKQIYFDAAFEEIQKMLEGSTPLNFKRAVFLTENAYYGGKLDWSTFNKEIQRIKLILKKMIAAKGIQQFKTAGNWAIFTYMSDSIPENNHSPYQYDFDNFMSDTDMESGMVTRLTKVKKGNCHSLPILYKILANEVNVEACIATAPMHMYVKHRDEKGEWWNLEMTTGTFSRSSFIMETFNISEVAIESGLYMKALTEKESVAQCIVDLLNYYEFHAGLYSDNFVRKCYTMGLKHYPISLLLSWKANDLKYQLDTKMASMGITDYYRASRMKELKELSNETNETFGKLKELGYSSLTSEQYREKVEYVRGKQMKLKKN
jgi:hypothetical protein